MEEPTTVPKTEFGLPEWPEHERLAHERELLGFYVTGHPLDPVLPLLRRYALTDTTTVGQLASRAMTRIGGIISAVQNGVSKKSGKPYCLATLEDVAGSVQILCLNENYDRYHDLLTPGKTVLVVGEVNTGDERPKIFPQEIMDLSAAPARYTRQVHLRLPLADLDAAKLERIREMIMAHRGKCPLFLCLKAPSGELVYIETHERYYVAPSVELQTAVDEAFGPETYYASVDTSLPEREKRRWERRGDANGSGE